MEQYIRKNNYETTSFDDEWIVLNTDNYTITKLNDTGGFCWSLLGDEQTVQSLSHAVAHKYTLDQKDIENDISAFMNHLIQCGLVEYVV